MSSSYPSIFSVAGVLLLATALGGATATADIAPPTQASSVTIDGDQASGTTSVTIGSAVEIDLSASFGSGFSWVLEPLAAQGPLVFLGTHDRRGNATPSGITGGRDIQIFSFRAEAAGTATLVFDYKRPWMKSEAPREIRRITIEVAP